MENKSVPNIQSNNGTQFLRFSKKIESGKHAYWFECLNEHRKKILYNEYLNKKKILEKSNKSFSLNKFLFNMRESKYFFIPKIKIREAAIEKLLK